MQSDIQHDRSAKDPANLPSCLHTVQFYSDDAFLGESISQFIGEALQAGGAGIAIAIEAHRDAIGQRLRDRGVDLTAALKQGRYVVLDAHETLTKFMVDDWLDETRFMELMGAAIERSRATLEKSDGDVAIFGEMVSLLWNEGKSDAAIRVEQLWNALAKTHSFSLRCAYPITGFDHSDHYESFIRICTDHSAVIPEEGYLSLKTDQERYRAIALLQQRARALESEITERKRAERLLQRREAELWDFLENAVVAMHWVSADGTISWANRAELRLLGYERGEYIGHPIEEFHADPAVIRDILERLGRHEELHGYEAELRCKDGSTRNVRIHSSVFVQDGKFAHTRCFTLDFTEQKRADEARLRLAAIVESSEDAIISKDLNGVVTSWNHSAERMFGYKAEEIIGRSITLIIPPELQQEETRILATLRRGERIEHFETVRISKTGERLDVSLTVSPVKDDDGRTIGAAKISRDIRQRKKLEDALRTTEKLAAVGRLASTIAHEVNNPLEAVTNLIYLAKTHGTASDAVRRYLSDAEEELNRAADLTRQTLGFYRDQTGCTGTQIGTHLKHLVAVSSSKAKNKRINIQLEIKQDPEIIAVPGEIRQVLANVLSNAIDAVDYGGLIRVRLFACHLGNRQMPGVRVTFFDTGQGIALSDYSKIFEPFYTTRPAVGTGLGLWICKSIVEKHGGTIRIRSNTTPGRSWTAVSILLPVDKSQCGDEAPLSKMDGSKNERASSA